MFSSLRAFVHTVVVFEMTCLSQLPGLLPHKFSVADLDIFLGLSYEVTSSWGLPQPITEEKVVASPVCPTTFHTIPSLCSISYFRGQEKYECENSSLKECSFGTNRYIDKFCRVIPGKFKLSLSCYTGAYQGNLFCFTEREKRKI